VCVRFRRALVAVSATYGRRIDGGRSGASARSPLSRCCLTVGVAVVATGVGKLTDETADGRTVYDRQAGAAWIVGGLVALGRPDLTTRGVALIAGSP
jgi:hypothetical protein